MVEKFTKKELNEIEEMTKTVSETCEGCTHSAPGLAKDPLHTFCTKKGTDVKLLVKQPCKEG